MSLIWRTSGNLGLFRPLHCIGGVWLNIALMLGLTKAFQKAAVENHLGSNEGVEARRMEVMLDRINPSRFGGDLSDFSSHGFLD